MPTGALPVSPLELYPGLSGRMISLSLREGSVACFASQLRLRRRTQFSPPDQRRGGDRTYSKGPEDKARELPKILITTTQWYRGAWRAVSTCLFLLCLFALWLACFSRSKVHLLLHVCKACCPRSTQVCYYKVEYHLTVCSVVIHFRSRPPLLLWSSIGLQIETLRGLKGSRCVTLHAPVAHSPDVPPVTMLQALFLPNWGEAALSLPVSKN